MKYRDSIAQYLVVNASHITLWWKGRVGLYALLKAYGVKAGDEVILPAFTCVVVPNAIIYSGAKPVYVDIDPQTMNIDVTKLRDAITSNTKVILAQNTFGLNSDLDSIMDIAKKNNIFVIEDCTHGFGGTYKGRKNGTIADAAFFSTQWNKPFSTGIGGFALTKDDRIAALLTKMESEALKSSCRERTQLALLLRIRGMMRAPFLYWPMIKLYRKLSKRNVVVGSSDPEEIQKPEMPPGFLKRMSGVQERRGVRELKRIDHYVAHRIAVAKKYAELFRELGLNYSWTEDHSYLKFPVLVKDRNEFFRKAEAAKVELGDWFISPIHPVTDNFTDWGYEYGNFPVAERISMHIVDLPTHIGVDGKYFKRIEQFLRANKSDLLNV